MPYDVGVIDAQCFHQDQQIEWIDRLISKPGRAAESTRFGPQHTIPLAEDRHLIIPHALVMGPAVNEHDGPASAREVVVDDSIADVEPVRLRATSSANRKQ